MGIMEPLEGLKESKSTPQKKPAATLAAINPPSMAEFKTLITKARIQGKKAGLKQSELPSCKKEILRFVAGFLLSTPLYMQLHLPFSHMTFLCLLTVPLYESLSLS